MGISGNRTDQLFDRLYPDAIDFEPDIISILIGVNDIWHRHSHNIKTTDEQLEVNYLTILTELRKVTKAKIVMLAPFALDAPASDGICGVQLANAMLLSTWLDKEIEIPFDDVLFYEELKKRIAISKPHTVKTKTKVNPQN